METVQLDHDCTNYRIVKLANSVFSTAEFANTEEKLQFCKKKLMF